VPHTFACDLRWADMDMLGHVNNVRYLDYLAAAREAAFEGSPVGTARVASHRVEFVRPLVFHREPVLLDTWVTDVGAGRLALAQEVYDERPDGDRRTYLRASSVLETGIVPDERDRERSEQLRGPDHTWRELERPRRPPRSSFGVQVRRADLDEAGLVSDAVLFEYLQESRIRYVMDLHTRGQSWTHHVIARTDVDYLRPIPHRSSPYDVHSWIGRVGTRSFTICAEVRDGDVVMASATVVMVTFDKEAQRPTAMADSQRSRLEAELAGEDA
jgi:acyl-CoA thioester hydrolase